jgi:HK97 family phage prohead protease
MADEVERRAVNTGVELRAGAEPTVSGYAALYNVETVIAGFFREQIAPGAFTSALSGDDDVRALFNHDPNYVLARNKNGTLVLRNDEKGLHYDIKLNPDDPDAQRVRAKIQRGDVSGSSFAFRVIEEKWQEPKTRADLALRTVLRAELLDVSPVTYPAYPQTSVSARSAATAAQESAPPVVDVTSRIKARIAVERAKAWGS